MSLENLDRWENDGTKGPNHYDWAVAGIPFLSAASSEYPYLRESLDTNKQQVDTSKEVGEQALGNWWYRSQSSFDLGANAFYTDTARDENISRRFFDSHGVDALETIGQVTLVNESKIKFNNTSSNLKTLNFRVGGVSGILFSQGTALKYLNTATDAVVEIEYGANETILDIDTDGSRYFVLTPNSIFAGALPSGTGFKVIEVNLNEDGTTDPIDAGVIKFIKERLVIGVKKGGTATLFQCAVSEIGANDIVIPDIIQGVDATDTAPKGIRFTKNGRSWNVGQQVLKVEGSNYPQYNFSSPKFITNVGGTAKERFRVAQSTLPAKIEVNKEMVYPQDLGKDAKIYLELANTPIQIYKTSASFWNWTGIADGPNGVYCAGYSGEKSSILFSTISKEEANDIPELQPPYVVAELPPGEIIYSMVSYLSVYLVIGTNRGVRVAIIDSRGGLIMVPLSIESDNDVKALAVSGDFVYAGGAKTTETGGTNRIGIYKLNLSKPVQENTLSFAYQKFLFADGVAFSASNNVSSINFVTALDKIYFGVYNVGIFGETSTKVSTGWLETGKIRLDTAEDKIFQYLRVSNLPVDGFISVHWRGENNLLSSTPINKWYGADYSGAPITGVLTDPKGIKGVDMEGTIPVAGEISAHQFVSYRFILQRGANTANTPVLLNYQVKANPANIKQTIIRVPLLALNRERGMSGLIIERPVFDRIRVLERAEQDGKVVLFQDFGTGEERLVIIEKLQFISNHIPESKAAADRGGILLVTVRTVDPVNTTGSLI